MGICLKRTFHQEENAYPPNNEKRFRAGWGRKCCLHHPPQGDSYVGVLVSAGRALIAQQHKKLPKSMKIVKYKPTRAEAMLEHNEHITRLRQREEYLRGHE